MQDKSKQYLQNKEKMHNMLLNIPVFVLPLQVEFYLEQMENTKQGKNLHDIYKTKPEILSQKLKPNMESKRR